MSSSDNNKTYKKTSFLAGTNTEFINEFYADYISDPSSLPESWKTFFDGLSDDEITEGGEPTRSSYQVIVNNLFDDSTIEDLEDDLIQKEDIKQKSMIHKLKKEFLHIRKSINPLRELIGRFSKFCMGKK